MGILSKIVGAVNPADVVPVVEQQTEDTLAYLKIKIVSLADEAVRIRREETRLIDAKTGRRDNPTRMGLMAHRKMEVRPEARAAQLAYAFLRGRSYKSLEAKCHEAPNWSRVRDLAVKYGPNKDRAAVNAALRKWSESA